jgi:predicted nuclease of predicted toxin-antitoxin system
VRGWLVDNNVPRSVTWLLCDKGEDAVEVRDVLGQEAPDIAVVAYAASQDRWLVTHDRGCAKDAWGGRIPHVWLRTPETRDVDRLREVLAAAMTDLEAGCVRVTLFITTYRVGR